jgi:3alpha(or 20beta)-hydroxysteroid dehydrogenase
MARLEGKVVIISGAAGGQGAAEAGLFVAEGAKVVLGDVVDEEGVLLAKKLGGSAVYERHDVTDEAQCRQRVDVALARPNIRRRGTMADLQAQHEKVTIRRGQP